MYEPPNPYPKKRCIHGPISKVDGRALTAQRAQCNRTSICTGVSASATMHALHGRLCTPWRQLLSTTLPPRNWCSEATVTSVPIYFCHGDARRT